MATTAMDSDCCAGIDSLCDNVIKTFMYEPYDDDDQQLESKEENQKIK